MKVIVLAGGQGLRMGGMPSTPPKALTPIAGKPIIDWIISGFAGQGFAQFIIALGHRAVEIERHLAGRHPGSEVVCVDTGPTTQTGGRLKRLAKHLPDEPFFMTWCDGLTDADFTDMARFHRSHERLATMMTAHPRSTYGVAELDGDKIISFEEKPVLESVWINAGFFVLNREIVDRIPTDETRFEQDVLERLATDGELMAYRHDGYWRSMDTQRDADELDEIWPSIVAGRKGKS